jgi:hypothetical protein
MDFSFDTGEKWIIVNDFLRAIERVHLDHPVWTQDLDKIKKYSSRGAAQKTLDKIKSPLFIQVKQVKDIFNRLYYIGRSTEKKNYGMIICGRYWVHQNATLDPDEYFHTREAAQEALDKLKQKIILEHHDLIMRCRDVKLPDPD